MPPLAEKSGKKEKQKKKKGKKAEKAEAADGTSSTALDPSSVSSGDKPFAIVGDANRPQQDKVTGKEKGETGQSKVHAGGVQDQPDVLKKNGIVHTPSKSNNPTSGAPQSQSPQKKKEKKKKKKEKKPKTKATKPTIAAKDDGKKLGESKNFAKDVAGDAGDTSKVPKETKGRARVTEVLESAKAHLWCPEPEPTPDRPLLDIVTNRSKLPQVTSWLTDVEIIEHVSSEEEILVKHRERNGMDATYLTRVGQLYRYLNDLPKAVVCFWGALLKDPLAKDALLSMSDLTFNLRYWKDAEYIVRQIFQLPGGGDVAQNHYVFGQALFAQNKVSEANQAFRRSLSLQPDLKPAQLALESSRHVARMIYTPDYENSTAAVIAACIVGTVAALYFFLRDMSEDGSTRSKQQSGDGTRLGKGPTDCDPPSNAVNTIKRILLVASLMVSAATLVLFTGFAKRQRGDDVGLYPSHPATGK